MLPSLFAAVLAGLVGSPHCAGMCGGFAVACGATPGRATAWHLGRLSTYGLLGAAAGAFGALIPGTGGLAAAVSVVLIVVFSAMLGGWMPEPRIRGRRLVQLAAAAGERGARTGSWAFGVANGFLPCGLVWAALALPIASGSAWVGAATMVAFGLGTTPLLTALALGARGLVLRDLRIRRLVAVGVLVSGLISVGLRQGLLPNEDHMHSPSTPAAQSADLEGSHSSLDG